MDVLVTGGTGFVGSALCRELDDRGHDVTAMARTPEESDLPSSVDLVAGDVTEYDDVDAAVEGHEAVVNLVSLSPLFKPRGGDEMHERVHLGGTENTVRAAEEHGVERFVQMSGLGADPDGRTHFLRAKGKAEEVVRESDLEWVILRPSVIFGDGDEFIGFTRKLTPPFLAPLPGGGKTRFQPIWIGDIAPMLADATTEPEHVGQTYELGGPEKLPLAQVAKLARKAKGQPVTIVPIPMELAGIGLSVMGSIPGFPFGADQYRSLKEDNVADRNDVEAFGVSEGDLKTLGEYLGLA